MLHSVTGLYFPVVLQQSNGRPISSWHLTFSCYFAASISSLSAQLGECLNLEINVFNLDYITITRKELTENDVPLDVLYVVP